MTTCASCSNWQLRASPMARQGMASCANGKRWDYLPPASTCGAYKGLEQAVAEKRVLWLGRLEEKHKQGAMK